MTFIDPKILERAEILAMLSEKEINLRLKTGSDARAQRRLLIELQGEIKARGFFEEPKLPGVSLETELCAKIGRSARIQPGMLGNRSEELTPEQVKYLRHLIKTSDYGVMELIRNRYGIEFWQISKHAGIQVIHYLIHKHNQEVEQ